MREAACLPELVAGLPPECSGRRRVDLARQDPPAQIAHSSGYVSWPDSAALPGQQHLRMLARNLEQAQSCASWFPPTAFPTRGSDGRDIHHRGKYRLTHVELPADRANLRRRERLDWRRQRHRRRAQGESLLSRQMMRERLNAADKIVGVELNVFDFHV